jgi:aarF domain-containing kinase
LHQSVFLFFAPNEYFRTTKARNMPRVGSTPQLTAADILTKLSQGLRILLGMKQTNIRFRSPDLRQCKRCRPAFLTSAKQQLPLIRDKQQNINVNEYLERGSMIFEGLRQFAMYRAGVTLPQNVTSVMQQASTTIAQRPAFTADSISTAISNLKPNSDNPYSGPAFTNTQSSINYQPEPKPEVIASAARPEHNKPPPPSHKSPPIRAERHLSSYSRESHVPSSRIARIGSFGSLVAGLGLGSLAEASKRTLGMTDGKDKPLFLSDANVSRIVETLCKVRGAALKLGQIISIQDEAIVSPEIAAAFERVRQSADFMPIRQMYKVMRKELGEDWKEKHFQSFNDKPFAAASIGQVHEAVLKDGSSVAVKIQYPGVAEGIESDIKNLMMIIKIWKILPDGMFVDNVMKTARLELGWEVNYEREAECQTRYAQFIEPYKDEMRIRVPKVYSEMSTKRVFVSELINGVPMDHLFKNGGDTSISQEKKNDIGARLLRLTLKEVFEFRFMQTDPNFSNYFYDASNDLIYLLDFGASREYTRDFIDVYFKLISAAAEQDYKLIAKYSRDIGFLTGFESKLMEEAHVNAVKILGEAFADRAEFDFGTQETSRKIAKLIPVMVNHRLAPPPEESYSLHRKMSGMFLLCAKMKAKINCRKIWDEECERFRTAALQ